MQRKATRQSRAANAQEKAFHDYTAHQPCICCGKSPVIVDHIYGSSKKLYHELERVMVGHWAVIPLCKECDDIKTLGSRRAFYETFGQQERLFLEHAENYANDTGNTVPVNVIEAIKGELWENI